MAKEDKPIPYERRTITTKSLAQRLILAYQREQNWLRLWKRRLTYGAPLIAGLAILPFFTGAGGSKRVFTNGPISTSHSLFEQDCKRCHSVSFAKVKDSDCKSCHDGPRHQASGIVEPRCAECHVEHKGSPVLTGVNDANCTRCHDDLSRQSKNLKTKALQVTAFCEKKHPEFSGIGKPDQRPIKLNHAVHLPKQPKTIRGVKLPMKCTDCHSFDRAGSTIPVTFEKHCASCHKGELGFDVYEILGAERGTAPHSKDPEGIARFIREAYTKALEANPGLTQRPLSRNLAGGAARETWLATAVRDSSAYLFEKKCRYCHEVQHENGLPVVAKVNRLAGRYVSGKPESERWLEHAEFRHPAHRMLTCESCHTTAVESRKTADILIPAMKSCLPCHGDSGTTLDNCSKCHYYHEKTSEGEPRRKSIEELVGWLNPSGNHRRIGDARR